MKHNGQSRYAANIENQRLLRAYRSARKIGHTIGIDTGRSIVYQETAQQALRTARLELAWADAAWDEWSEPEIGAVRLRIVPDDDPSSALDYLNQDCYTDKYRESIRELAERDGVNGLIGEYFDGTDWQHADSIWGTIGLDFNGYETDIKAETLRQAEIETVSAWQ
jgi:hypothetical protein